MSGDSSIEARIFLLVDLRDIFFRFWVGGRKKIKQKSSENDQLTGHFQDFFFFFFFRAFFFFFFNISRKNSKPTVCIKSLYMSSFS